MTMPLLSSSLSLFICRLPSLRCRMLRHHGLPRLEHLGQQLRPTRHRSHSHSTHLQNHPSRFKAPLEPAHAPGLPCGTLNRPWRAGRGGSIIGGAKAPGPASAPLVPLVPLVLVEIWRCLASRRTRLGPIGASTSLRDEGEGHLEDGLCMYPRAFDKRFSCHASFAFLPQLF